jgi:Ca2+-binding RTX toxin-like protein
VASIANLTGTEKDDFFIGGPGENTIAGGAGNDTIYAHADYAAQKGKLIVSLSFSGQGTFAPPQAAIAVNGVTAVPATPITSRWDTGTQVFTIDVSALPAVAPLVITVTNTTNSGQNYSNVTIDRVIWNGVGINLASAVFSSGAYDPRPEFAYSNSGTVTIPGSVFAAPSPFLANTSSTIDGGSGTNTVIYRGTSSDYVLTKLPNGSWTVTSASTAEGPDTLTNVQRITFVDQTIDLN